MSGLEGLDEGDLEELTKAIDFSDIGLGPPGAWETPRGGGGGSCGEEEEEEEGDSDDAEAGLGDEQVDGPKLLTPSDVLDMAAYLGATLTNRARKENSAPALSHYSYRVIR
jgi:hypothetical protein